MELTLAQQTGTEVSVTCDGKASHAFDLQTLLLNRENEQALLHDPIAYGRRLYAALFPPHTLAQHALAAKPKRLLIVPASNHLDAVPWEYAYGCYGSDDPSNSAGFLVLECQFVRGLPANESIDSHRLETDLHIIAVPSNPLSSEIEPLNIEGEWTNLRKVIQEIPYAITLERARPPTVERVRQVVANQKGRVVHFMGHGGQSDKGALLSFEQENGDLDWVTAEELAKRLRGTTFLVTLNACVSAKPGPALFSNLAAALVRLKTPYALGMRLSIVDEDARTFSRNFYSELARGSPVEDALFQARLTLARSPRRWVIGVPVLYTALAAPAPGFACSAGKPTIKEYQPPVESSALPRVEGTFQGRIEELKQLGTYLAGDRRQYLVTIHGVGGQGKTALAREFIERFAYAWTDGVWAISLENLPDQWRFVADLAHFLGLDSNIIRQSLIKTMPASSIHKIEEEVQRQLERLVLARVTEGQILIVLDNAETLIEMVNKNDPAAQKLAQFIQQKVRGQKVSLLVTSRYHLRWAGETLIELGGLSPIEGARLFRQSAPSRQADASGPLAKELSEKVEGQPLSLRLLGGAFDFSKLTLEEFLKDHEQVLLNAENKYTSLNYRQRNLFASIETSVRYLDHTQRCLLSKLSIFRAPFLAETAAAIFNSVHSIQDHISALWKRGFLTCEILVQNDDRMIGLYCLYHLLPTTRLYIDHYIPRSHDFGILERRFGQQHYEIVYHVWSQLNRTPVVAFAQKTRENLEQGWKWVAGIEQAYYLLRWGFIVHRWGSPIHGLELLERALEMAQGVDRELELHVLHNMAQAYQETHYLQESLQLSEQTLLLARRLGKQDSEASILAIMADVYRLNGQPEESLKLCQQAVSIAREVGDKEVQSTALNNISLAYNAIGQPQAGFEFLEQALPIEREIGNRRGEAFVLNNIAYVYSMTEQPQEALSLYKRALRLFQELGDRRAEAMVLSNMAAIYRKRGQLQEAMALVEQALAIQQAAGGETALGLNSLASLYSDMENYSDALKSYGRSVTVAQQVDYPAAEVGGLVNMAFLRYNKFGDSKAAILNMDQAIRVLETRGLGDAFGYTIEELQYQLRRMRAGMPPVNLNIEDLIVGVSETMAEGGTDRGWREIMANMLTAMHEHFGEERYYQEEIDLSKAVVDILDRKLPTLPSNHRYARAIARIMGRIADSRSEPVRVADPYINCLSGDVVRYPPVLEAIDDFVSAADSEAACAILEAQHNLLFRPEVEVMFEQKIEEAKMADEKEITVRLELHLKLLRDCKRCGIAQALENLESALFDTNVIPGESIKALLGGPQEKAEHAHYLAALSARITDEQLKTLIHVIYCLLRGMGISPCAENLAGRCKLAWNTIIGAVMSVDSVHNTLAVLEPLNEWREKLCEVRNAMAAKEEQKELRALFDSMLELLNAGGNPAGLGTGLTGLYEEGWQRLVSRLHHRE